jgi:hypothetical protein
MLCLILIVGGLLIMMGQHDRSEALFYYFRLEDQVPENHLLRLQVAPETTFVWADVSSALALICWLTVVRFSDAVAKFTALLPILPMFWRKSVKNFFSPSPICPMASLPLTEIS